MGLREGPYAIAHASDDHRLQLHRGQWWQGQVTTSGAKNDKATDNQEWLLAHAPGTQPDTYVLFNVSLGVYAGLWDPVSSASRSKVKCSPSRSSAGNVQWKAIGADDKGSVTFRWVGDEAKLLSSGAGCGSSVCLTHANTDGGSNSWRLTELEPGADTWPNWMDRLPDNIKLSDINLPSTHQSLASHGIRKVRPDLDWSESGDTTKQPWWSRLGFVKGSRPWVRLPMFIENPHCQNASIWEQLHIGIRSFDLRLDIDRNLASQGQSRGSSEENAGQYFLYARHGLAEIGHSWSAVLLTLKVFLQRNPSELILLNVRYEKARDGARNLWPEWQRTFVEETSPFWQDGDSSIIYQWWEHNAPNMSDLTLADVRGKVICTTDGDYMPQDDRDGRRGGCRFMPRDMRAVGKYDSLRAQWDTQLSDCEANLAAAKACPAGDATYFQTSLNVSGLPNPLKYKFVFSNILSPAQARGSIKNEVFDPIDFFDYFRKTWAARGEQCPFSEESLGKNGQHRIGKVDLDYVDGSRDWVANIVRSNRTKEGREF